MAKQYTVETQAAVGNAVDVVTSINGQQSEIVTVPPAPNGEIDAVAVKETLKRSGTQATIYAKSQSIELNVSVHNRTGGSAPRHFVIDAGGMARKTDTPHAMSSLAKPRAARPVKPTRPSVPLQDRTVTVPGTTTRTPSHAKASPFTKQATDDSPNQTHEPAPWTQNAQVDVAHTNNHHPSELPTRQPPPALVPVADNTVRRKASDAGKKSSFKATFMSWVWWKKTIAILAAAIFVLFIVRFVGGGGDSEYTAICVDQRTMMRQLDSAPCAQGQVRFFTWYFIENGEQVPSPNTDYTSANGTFDKPSKGTITYT